MLMRIIAQPLLNENSLFSQELSTNPHVENVDSVDNAVILFCILHADLSEKGFLCVYSGTL